MPSITGDPLLQTILTPEQQWYQQQLENEQEEENTDQPLKSIFTIFKRAKKQFPINSQYPDYNGFKIKKQAKGGTMEQDIQIVATVIKMMMQQQNQQISDQDAIAKAQQLKKEQPDVFAQVLSEGSQMMQQQQASMNRKGGQLNYLRTLRNQCPNGYETEYFKAGGAICSRCRKKAEMKKGGEVEEPKTAVAAFKAKCGGKTKKVKKGAEGLQSPAPQPKKPQPKQQPKPTSQQPKPVTPPKKPIDPVSQHVTDSIGAVATRWEDSLSPKTVRALGDAGTLGALFYGGAKGLWGAAKQRLGF